MSAVLRRIVANQRLSSSILRQSSVSSRVRSKRVFSATEKICLPPCTIGSSRNYFHSLSLGYLPSTGSIRDVMLNSMPIESRFIRQFSSDTAELVDAVVPFMGESITDGTLVQFLKNPGDRVEVDEPIAQVETDKVTIDIASPDAGVIQEFVAKEGDTVKPGVKIAIILKGGECVTQAATPEKVPQKDVAEKPSTEKMSEPKARTASLP